MTFKILSDRDHILQRPQMYIGSIAKEKSSMMLDFVHQEVEPIPGLLKIINEIIDNSVDEAIRTGFKYANKIDVSIEYQGPLSDRDYLITVKDNGRGIPIVKHSGVYQAEAAWTRAKAGTSFVDDRQTIGANGVGSFCTNVFSSYFKGESCDGSHKIEVLCADSCNPDRIHTVKKICKTQGTKIEFVPNLDLFDIDDDVLLSDDHYKVIRDRLVNLAICYPKIKFSFNKEKLNPGNLVKIAKSINAHCLAFEYDNIRLVLGPSGLDEEFRQVSYVNGLNMQNGGTHIDYIVTSIAYKLQPLIKKKWKIDVLPNQIKQHLFLGLWADGFVNPKFNSQSKERLTNSNSEVKEFFKAIEIDKIAKKIISTEAIINPMIASILYKKQLAEARKANAALKKTNKKKIVKHISASSNKSEDKILHVFEGFSASSEFLNCRTVETSKIYGGYSLRGKVMNTHNMKPTDIVKNQELLDLISILGLDLSNPMINEVPTQLYELVYKDVTYIVSKDDSIIDVDGNVVKVTEIMKEV